MENYYKDFYKYYDSIMEETDYQKWSEYIFNLSEETSFDNKDVLDLACGSGKMLLNFVDKFKGNFYGVDLSEGMLSIADQRLFRHKKRVRLIRGDMPEFQIDKQFDFIYSAGDCINYIFDKNDLLNTFINVNKMLKLGGIFTFDILNDDFDLNDTRTIKTNGMTFNIERIKQDNVFTTNINVHGKTFSHKQRLYTIEEIEDLLKFAKFTHIEIYNFLTEDNSNFNEEKIQFKVKKY